MLWILSISVRLELEEYRVFHSESEMIDYMFWAQTNQDSPTFKYNTMRLEDMASVGLGLVSKVAQ